MVDSCLPRNLVLAIPVPYYPLLQDPFFPFFSLFSLFSLIILFFLFQFFSLVNRAERPSLKRSASDRQRCYVPNSLARLPSSTSILSSLPFSFSPPPLPPSTNVFLCFNDSQFLPTFLVRSLCPLEEKIKFELVLSPRDASGLISSHSPTASSLSRLEPIPSDFSSYPSIFVASLSPFARLPSGGISSCKELRRCHHRQSVVNAPFSLSKPFVRRTGLLRPQCPHRPQPLQPIRLTSATDIPYLHTRPLCHPSTRPQRQGLASETLTIPCLRQPPPPPPPTTTTTPTPTAPYSPTRILREPLRRPRLRQAWLLTKAARVPPPRKAPGGRSLTGVSSTRMASPRRSS